MFRKTYRFLPVLIIILFSCSREKHVPVDIITSLFPVYDIVKNTAPENISVDFAIPEGANPHVFEPTPSLAIKIKRAKVFIGVHPDLDGWMEKYLNSNAHIIYLKDALPENKNPHLWLSIHNTKRISNYLSKQLQEIYPEKKDQIRTKQQSFSNELNILDHEIKEKFASLKNKKVIQWHPAWNDFAADYGIQIVDSIQKGHGDKPSLKKMRTLIQKAKAHDVHIVLIGLKVQSVAVETLVKEINGTLVKVDGIGRKKSDDRNTYINLMRFNANAIAHAMKSE